MYILLPPSEGKSDAAGTIAFAEAHPSGAADCAPVIDHLSGLKPAEQRKCYGVSTVEKAAAAHARNLAALHAGGLPAIERYTGVVYGHIDYGTLGRKATARKRLLVVSALFGLIDGGTPIPDYKLPISPWFANYWKPLNSERLQRLAKGRPVLNLLSQSYQKALDYPELVTVDFRTQGGKKAAGHFGKAIKGRFVRWVLENNVRKVADFNGFQEDGYRFDGVHFIQD